MTSQELFGAAQAYNQLVSAFKRSLSSAADASSRADASGPLHLILDIAGYRAHIRGTSAVLYEQLRRPLAHLEVAPDASSASFTIDFIDGTKFREIPIRLPGTAQRRSPEQETQEFQVGPFLFTLHGDCVLTIFNQVANHSVGIVRDPAHWPLEHYQQAIFISLYQHLLTRGLFLIHASAIGRDGQAVLFSAKSGAGKTTTMLACVQAGFDFYSDDATLLRRNEQGQVEVISLLGSMNVTDRTLEWFPQLTPYTSEVASRTGKRLVMIRDVFPRCVAKTGIVRAIVAPEIGHDSHASIAPTSKMSLLRELLPYSLDLHDANAAKEHLDFLLEVLKYLPCYKLKLGVTRADLPGLLKQVLAAEG